MKHIKLFEDFVNEGYYSSADVKKLKEFAKKVSDEIMDEYADEFDRRSSGLNAKEFTPSAMFDYISEWGEDNDMSAKEVIDEFKWNTLTQELGLD